MVLAQTLEVPTSLERFNRLDEQILLLLKDEELPLEQIMALAHADQSDTLSTITRLIADGYLELVISEYHWGIEFELAMKGQAKRQ